MFLILLIRWFFMVCWGGLWIIMRDKINEILEIRINDFLLIDKSLFLFRFTCPRYLLFWSLNFLRCIWQLDLLFWIGCISWELKLLCFIYKLCNLIFMLTCRHSCPLSNILLQLFVECAWIILFPTFFLLSNSISVKVHQLTFWREAQIEMNELRELVTILLSWYFALSLSDICLSFYYLPWVYSILILHTETKSFFC